jgi:hypothetical protein
MPRLLLLLVACGAPDPGPEPRVWRVVTANTGTGTELPHEAPPDDGYTDAHAQQTDDHYGNGLSWPPAEAALIDWLAATAPDLVGFQELFWEGWCADFPPDPALGLLCSRPDDGLVQAQRLVGAGFQVACHPGKPDKCLAVRRSVATFRGCSADLCLEGLDGPSLDGCGSGARVAWGDLDLPDGTTVRAVHVHGSSGLSRDDQDCRLRQATVALDAAEGRDAVVLGDLNTDPGRFAEGDPSAAAWADAPLTFVSDVGPDAPGTYLGLADIDHVLATEATGRCDPPEDPVYTGTFFDHVPLACTLTWPAP